MDLKKLQHGAKQKGKGKGKPKADMPPATSNLEHNCRTSSREHPDRNRGNEKIDPARTHLNYDLAAPLRNGKSALEVYADKYKSACEDYAEKNGKALRGDAVTLMSWVVTAPKDLPEEYHDEFFKGAYEWLANRYGVENVIAANVHMDETTPHMHFQFMPLVADKEHGGTKLCAKGIETAATMKKIHPALQKYLTDKLGVKVHLLNGATEHGKKTIEEMKLETLERQQTKIKTDVAKMQIQQAHRAEELDLQEDRLAARGDYIDYCETTLDKRAAALKERETDLGARETAADERAAALDKREADLNDCIRRYNAAVQRYNADRKALNAQQTAADQRAAALDEREKTLENRAALNAEMQLAQQPLLRRMQQGQRDMQLMIAKMQEKGDNER